MQAKEDYCQTRESPQYKLMGELQLNQFSVQKTQQSTPIQVDGGSSWPSTTRSQNHWNWKLQRTAFKAHSHNKSNGSGALKLCAKKWDSNSKEWGQRKTNILKLTSLLWNWQEQWWSPQKPQDIETKKGWRKKSPVACSLSRGDVFGFPKNPGYL